MARTNREPVYALAKLLIPPVVRFWVRLETCGAMNIPPHGPVIIAANHLSYFDPLCLATFIDAAGRKVRFLAKAELWEHWFTRWALQGSGQIPVYRETRDAAKSLDAAVEAMRRGAALAIYPEGTTTRNADFSPMKPKSGVARLAALTGAPVVPVGMWGAHLLFRRGQIGPFRRGARVVIKAGPPIDLGLGPTASLDAVNAGRDRVMEAIGALVTQARQGWTPPAWYKAPSPGKARA